MRDTEQNIHSHSYVGREIVLGFEREKTAFIDVCLSITHLNTKKHTPSKLGEWNGMREKKNDEACFACTTELIDSADNITSVTIEISQSP